MLHTITVIMSGFFAMAGYFQIVQQTQLSITAWPVQACLSKRLVFPLAILCPGMTVVNTEPQTSVHTTFADRCRYFNHDKWFELPTTPMSATLVSCYRLSIDAQGSSLLKILTDE